MREPLLVTNPTNIRYLTGFVGVEKGDVSLLVIGTRRYLFTNSLLLEQAKQLADRVTVIEVSADTPFSKQLKSVLTKERLKRLTFEADHLTVAEYSTLKKTLTDVTLRPAKGEVEKRRMVKKTDELSAIKKAAAITDGCFKFATTRIRPGITEARLAWEIEGFLRAKAGDIAFSPIVAFGSHSSQPHYTGRGNTPLRRGSLVLLDFGARINGYCADMTRVIFVGNPSAEWKAAYAAVLGAQAKAIALLASGERSGKMLDQAAQDVISKAGFPVYPHSLGHAVGLDIHESPRLSIRNDSTLTDGMVVTLEPAIYKEGEYGIRIEDLVLLKKGGIELLSKAPKALTIL